MRFTPLLLLATTALTVAGLAWLFRSEPQGKAAPPAPLPLPVTAGFQGVASCSAAACHGNGQPSSRGGECDTWLAHDPHARAYAVLREERSRAIEKKLNPGVEPRPERNPVCLNCHVQPG